MIKTKTLLSQLLILAFTFSVYFEAEISVTSSTSVTVNTSCKAGTDKMCALCILSKCTYCWEGYPDSDGVCRTPKTKVEHCSSYNSNSTCQSCKAGYTLNKTTAKCESTTIKNCSAQKDGKCERCTFALLFETKCGDSCPENCTFCSKSGDKTTCDQCKAGYNRTSGTCVKASSSLEFCIVNEGKCTSCDFGAYVSYYSATEIRCSFDSRVLVQTLLALLFLIVEAQI